MLTHEKLFKNKTLIILFDSVSGTTNTEKPQAKMIPWGFLLPAIWWLPGDAHPCPRPGLFIARLIRLAVTEFSVAR